MVINHDGRGAAGGPGVGGRAAESAQAATISITSNTNWSAISTGSGPGGQPNSSDTIRIYNAATLTVNVTNGTVGSIQVGAPGITGNYGILTFNSNAQVTVSGNVTVGGYGNTARSGTINMGSGATLTVNGTLTLGGTGTSAAPGTLNMTNGGTVKAQALAVGTGTRTFTPGTGNVELTATNTLPNDAAFTNFNNLTINGGTTTSTYSVFTVGNNLTVTQGNLILQATNADYVVTNNLTVSTNGTLTHSVNWDVSGKLLKVSGNIAIDGVFAYTVRSHVQMSSPTGTATRTVRTGANSASAFSILTLVNGGTASTVNADGTLKVDDNFWAGFNSNVSFHTNGQPVTALSSLLNAGGTVYIDGGSLNITGGLQIGTGV